MATRKTVKKETEEVKIEKASEKTFTEDEVKSLIAKAVSDALAQAQANVVQISTDKPLVKMLCRKTHGWASSATISSRCSFEKESSSCLTV